MGFNSKTGKARNEKVWLLQVCDVQGAQKQ